MWSSRPSRKGFGGQVVSDVSDLSDARRRCEAGGVAPPTPSSTWRRSSPARLKRISTRAIASISTAPGALFEAIRQEGLKSPYNPRVVFTSSIAVFGAPFPDKIADEFIQAPLTSYGTQKTIDELLLSDYSRKGFFDGIGIRLPTICIRPASRTRRRPASSPTSCANRSPARKRCLPVPDDVRHWHASPRAAVGFLIHAATLDTAKLGARRNLNMPGLSATVGEQLEALKRFGGEKALKLIRREPDATIGKIVAGWPRDFDPKRAVELGFKAEKTFDEIIKIHIEDELGGKVA